MVAYRVEQARSRSDVLTPFRPQTGLQQYCFLVFLVVCCLVAIYIFLVVPETKNKTFLEIHNEFQSKKKPVKADSAEGKTSLLSTPL